MPRAAGRVADLEGEDLLGLPWGPGGVRGEEVGFAVGVGRGKEGERAQRALDGRDGEAGARVEGARALARAAPAHEVPLAGQDHARDELASFARDSVLVREALLRGERAARFLRELPDRDGAARPKLGARASGVAFIEAVIVRFVTSISGKSLITSSVIS